MRAALCPMRTSPEWTTTTPPTAVSPPPPRHILARARTHTCTRARTHTHTHTHPLRHPHIDTQANTSTRTARNSDQTRMRASMHAGRLRLRARARTRADTFAPVRRRPRTAQRPFAFTAVRREGGRGGPVPLRSYFLSLFLWLRPPVRLSVSLAAAGSPLIDSSPFARAHVNVRASVWKCVCACVCVRARVCTCTCMCVTV